MIKNNARNSKVKITLDKKDKKILSALSLNARLPATTIAKAVGLSRDAVRYRMKKYEDSGLIDSYKTVINTEKFGFDNYHVFLQFKKISRGEKTRVLKSIDKHKAVRGVIEFSGKFDAEIGLITKSVSDFEKYLAEVLALCEPYISQYEILMLTSNFREGAFPNRFLVDVHGIEKRTKKKETYTLDKKDLKILRAIGNDARRPLFEIANELGLSADAVKYRIRKLINAEYIKKFIPSINYDLLDYTVFAVMISLQGLNSDDIAKLKSAFEADQNVLWAVKTLGKYNVLSYIVGQSSRDIHDTMLSLREKFPDNFSAYEVLIAHESYGYNYVPEIVTEG